jgi:putative sterol carrier protein
MAIRFLSDEWAAAVKEGLSANDDFKGASKGSRARIQQVVTTGDEDLSYWVVIDDGSGDAGTGRIEAPSLTITSSYETAEALAKGELSPMAAFIAGKIEVSSVMAAMGLQGALAAVGAIIKDIDTEY